MSLLVQMRERTRALHGRAERTGVVREMLAGTVTRYRYALYLRNLLPAYVELERALDRHRDSAAIRPIAYPQLRRADPLRADLRCLCGEQWMRLLPQLDAGRLYAERVRDASHGEGHGLIAHAYTRYLGDLNGGAVLSRVLARTLGLEAAALAFYQYPTVADRVAFLAVVRQAFDQAGAVVREPASVLQEVEAAFACNIDLSLAASCAAESA